MPQNFNLAWQYLDALAALKHAAQRKAPHGTHTVLRRNNQDVELWHYSTRIISWHPDNTATLNTGGHLTSTTKHRLVNYTNAVIWQKDFAWYIQSGRQPFVDGMRIDCATGNVVLA